MYGQSVDTLNLYIKSRPSLDKPIFTRKGNLGNLWLQGQIEFTGAGKQVSWVLTERSIYLVPLLPIPKLLFLHNPFGLQQIVFEGIVGRSYQGDISIDDVRLDNGACSSKYL